MTYEYEYVPSCSAPWGDSRRLSRDLLAGAIRSVQPSRPSRMIELGYWKIRGLAGSIRLMLKHTGEQWTETIYEQGDPSSGLSRPELNKEWLSVKETLGLPFPNLPWLVDGDVKLTQSTAILRYIARKHGLLGATTEEAWKADMIAAEGIDMNSRYLGCAYGFSYTEPYEVKKAEYLKSAQVYLKRFEDFLGDNDWFAGAGLTWADFIMWHQLDLHVLMEPTALDAYPKLKAFLARFEALPAIKDYIPSPEFIYWPINNKVAKFGGGGPCPRKF